MKSKISLVLLFSAMLFAGGCATVSDGGPGAEDQVPVEDVQAGAEAGAEATGAQMGGEFAGDPLRDPDSPLSQRVFYFDFDSSELSAADRDALMAHGRYLAAHPEIALVVEGHADERGTREYNLALGERRAKAAEQVLLIQGAGRDQLQVVSFGEERPVAMGHDEEAWRLNRRVELLYQGY